MLRFLSFAKLFFLNWFLQIKCLIGSDKGTLSILERFVAGSLAGVIAQSTIYPMEVIISLIRFFLWCYDNSISTIQSKLTFIFAESVPGA